VFFALVADREMEKLSTRGRVESMIEAADEEAREFVTDAEIIVSQVDNNEFDPTTFSHPIPLKMSSLDGLLGTPEVSTVTSLFFQASVRAHLVIIQRANHAVEEARSAAEARFYARMQASEAYALIEDLKLEREYLKGGISKDSLLVRRRAILVSRRDAYRTTFDSLSSKLDSLDATKAH
jgi:hypothetical protein